MHALAVIKAPPTAQVDPLYSSVHVTDAPGTFPPNASAVPLEPAPDNPHLAVIKAAVVDQVPPLNISVQRTRVVVIAPPMAIAVVIAVPALPRRNLPLVIAPVVAQAVPLKHSVRLLELKPPKPSTPPDDVPAPPKTYLAVIIADVVVHTAAGTVGLGVRLGV